MLRVCCLQTAQDQVDIISLSVTPNRRPPGVATFFNPIDMALLFEIMSRYTGTGERKLYKLLLARHALNDDTLVLMISIQFDLCWDSPLSNGPQKQPKASVQLVWSSYMDPFVIGFQLNPVPMQNPGIIIASKNDSKLAKEKTKCVCALLEWILIFLFYHIALRMKPAHPIVSVCLDYWNSLVLELFEPHQDWMTSFGPRHTASVAAGNHGIPVIVAGHHFGNASGMAPRSHIAVYKALYKSFGGFAADVVAAIDQAAQDGVDIISLSITPNRRPPGVATFFNPIDMALLSAVKVGIFVVQAAGNTGPSPTSMFSFSPWIFTVGAASHDRVYSNSIFLGNNVTIPGVGLAPGTDEKKLYKLILARHALNNDTSVADDMYVGECQDASKFNKTLIKRNLLMCSYSIRFVLGLSTIKRASETAKNLSAAGVVFYMDPFVIGFQLNPVPMQKPGIIIASTNDSKILMQYYNSSLEIDAVSKKIVQFGAVAGICGGLKANYGNSAPKVMYYSARGPDPEDTLPHEADILKPNLLAPGNFIWAAWSSVGTDSVEFLGENFALMSGTSMAAPHVAGLAALIKQKFPNFSPAAIGSALSTTASLFDKSGEPIMAQRSYASPELNQSPATPFDMGSGFVNASGALNPGLVFDSGYDDYMSFLCGINGSAPVVLNYTGQNCGLYNSTVYGPDLNLPSITISKLNQSRIVQRTVQNIAQNESYSVGWTAPDGVSVKVSPTHFSINNGERQVLSVLLNATLNSSVASFGRIGLFGNQGHVINIPISVMVKISSNTSTS
ncbi:hypothetical protein VNO78_03187 [Psophocarpus tetragonolobus]|uniref:Subtilisin-like protease SBT2.2 n=1 Tax=Psophocarpus tetragonolobus TaxID=3891 RepID=A0AAN9XWQ9_PSOTE